MFLLYDSDHIMLRDELGIGEIPFVEGLDFGHTDPYFPGPGGIQARIQEDEITLLESLTR